MNLSIMKSSKSNKRISQYNQKNTEICYIILLFLVSVFVLFIFSNVACAEEYYVSTYGDNNDTGLSIEHAWATPSHAGQQAVAGDTVYLVNGTWYDEHISFVNSGTTTNQITFTAYNGTPILDGVDWTGTAFNINSNSYINISSITINNYRIGVYISGSNITVHNTTINKTYSNGIKGYGISSLFNILITHNTLLNTGGGSLAGTIDTSGFKNSVVEYNYIVAPNAIGIGTSGATQDTRIQGNTILNPMGHGISFYIGQNIIVSDNIIRDGQSRGIRFDYHNKGIVINNNTLENIAGSGLNLYPDTSGIISNNKILNSSIYGYFSDFVFKNNIVTEKTSTLESPNLNLAMNNNVFSNMSLHIRSMEGNFENNILWGSSVVFENAQTNVTSSYNYLDSYSSISGETTATNYIVNIDPLFADPMNYDFHLKSAAGRWSNNVWIIDGETSPLIDAGNSNMDYTNEPQPNGAKINIGAYGNTPEASKSTAGDLLPFNFFLSNSGSITVNKGCSGSNIITANLVSGTTEPVTFSITGLPSSSSHSLSGGNSCSPTCSKTLTIYTTNTTPLGSYLISITVTNGTLLRTTNFNLVVTISDTIPPAAVTNLATSNPTSNSIALTWTAPGDDGNTGTAAQYDIRYSTSTINDANWASATKATRGLTPAPAGTSQSFTVTGLSSSTTYYFAIRTGDEVSNWAGISNGLQGTTVASSANTYYVRTDGNDNCNGQYNNGGISGNCAWRTIQKAASTITAGQTVRIQNGTYYEKNIQFASGNANKIVNVVGDNNPIINGAGSRNNIMKFENKQYINVSGISLTNALGVSIKTSSWINLDSIKVYDTSGNGIQFRNSVTNSIISNSIIHDSEWNEIQVYGDPYYGNSPSSNITIKANEVFNCGHSCIDIHTMATDINIINNAVHRNSGVGNGGIYVHNGYVAGRYHNRINIIGNIVYNNYWGILLEQAKNSIVSGNILYSNSRGIDAYANFNTTIDHNIIYNSNREGIGLWDSLGTSQNNTIESNTIRNINGNGILINENRYNIIKNNIVVDNNQYGINAGALTEASYNDVWGNTAGNYNGGVSAGTGSISADPLFVSTSKFHLKGNQVWKDSTWFSYVTDSPAIGAGDPTSDNSKSPWSGIIEMGAYGNTPEASKSASSVPSFDYYLSNSDSIIINQRSSGSNTIIANLISGTTEPVTFSVNGLPSSSSFSLIGGNSCNSTCSKTLTIYTTNSTLIGTYPITVSATDGTFTKTATFDLIVDPPSPYTTLTLTSSSDTSIKSGEPNLIRDKKTWLDLGRLYGVSYGNYRGLLYFDLSEIPSTAVINTATLELIWEGENRNQTTVIDVFRPSTVWDGSNATWYSRQNGVSWINSGGDWVDKNGVLYGDSSYDQVIYLPGSKVDANFNVTSLVQEYVSGKHINTGYFLKANELENTYISFHSYEASNASQRPKLSITYIPEAGPVNHAPIFAPIGDKSVTEGSLLQFTINATDPNGDSLSYSAVGLPTGAALDGTSGIFTWTPASGQASSYQVHFEVTDGSFIDTENVTIMVNDITAEITYIWVEAEDADEINPSMQPASDPSASNNTYIWIPEGEGFNGTGYAKYTIIIPTNGEYKIYGRIIAETNGDNSFFVQVDDNAERLWTMTVANNWIWDEVNHWGNGTESNPEIDPVVYNLSAGEHILIIKHREDGTKLDKLLITNNMTYIPQGDMSPLSHAPTIDAIGDKSVTIGSPLQFTITANDPTMTS
jgi:parallel beta-helix repeat protein